MRSVKNENIFVDVAIVGLGPAGASCANVCALNGLSVFGIDAKPRAGFPVQCAEFVPSLFTNETMEAFNQSQQTIDKMRTFVESEAADEKIPFSGRIIDREKFDAQLVALAIKNGADLHFATRAIAIENNVLLLNNGKKIVAKYIIGSDGPHSLVGKNIGIENTQFLETRQIKVHLLKPLRSTDIYLSAEYIGGYAWLFPKNEFANLGIGVLHEYRDLLKPLLNQLHERLYGDGLISSEILNHTGGAIPVNGMLLPYKKIDNSFYLLAGDALGLTNPITGAGIPAAFISGRMAGEAIVAFESGDENAFDNYQEELCDLFQNALNRAKFHFDKLLKIHNSNQKPNSQDLRNSWVAYNEYWKSPINIFNQEEENDLLKT
jgi:digeranylgeranylglycerophospholipid reductase